MTILLIRVGADLTEAGGRWNGIVDGETREFVYAPIVEPRPFQPGLETPYVMVDRVYGGRRVRARGQRSGAQS